MRYPKRSQYKHAKSRYRVRNWAEYEAGLQKRGDLTVWLQIVRLHLDPFLGVRSLRRAFYPGVQLGAQGLAVLGVETPLGHSLNRC